MAPLNLNHTKDLQSSGLTTETIRVSGVYSVNAREAAQIVGLPLTCAALVFPFSEGSGRASLLRVKPDVPYQPPGWKKPAKYLSPRGSRNRLYVPPTLDRRILRNPGVPLLFTEGEKKTLAAVQEGFACVGLAGVYSWSAGKDPETGQKHVIPDLETIDWPGRKVCVVYDSDAETNPQVRAAERALAEELNARGADTLIVRLPSLPGVPKVGLDDFLVHRGKEALQELIDEACPPAEKLCRLTDLGNAERLIARHGRNLRYCLAWGKWLIWNGSRWRVDDTAEIVRLAKDTVRSIYGEAEGVEDEERRKKVAGWASKSESVHHIRAMISLAEPEVPVIPDELDADQWLLNTQDGTIDLRTGTRRESRREDLLTKRIPVTLDLDADCPTWLSFLDRVMDGNEGLIDFLQKAVGYALTGDISEECLFILYGRGSNGKSTFVETIEALLGDYARQTPAETLMMRRGDGIPNDLARLKGSRFVSSIETEEGRPLAEAKVKQLTGGDTVTARFLHREFFEFRPEFKLFLACNHKPQIRGTDEAIWRRIRLIPFSVHIPPEERDATLKGPHGRLQVELPGILNWALEGCLRWQQEGLGVPTEVAQATSTYRDDMDVIGAFIEECCVLGDGYWAKAKDIYDAYTTWCDANGEKALKQRDLGTRLTERGFERSRRGGGAWGRQRIGLLAEIGDVPPPCVTASEVMKNQTVGPKTEPIGDVGDADSGVSAMNSPHVEKTRNQRHVGNIRHPERSDGLMSGVI